MNPRRMLAMMLLLVLTAARGTGAVSGPSGIDPRLRLEYDVVETKTGRVEIRGYVYNDYGRAAIGVRILVESLDASGQAQARALGFVPGVVPALNRSYFDTPVKVPGAGYRVTVASFDWREGA
jgi:hypothetical protein